MRRAVEFGAVWDAPYVDPATVREGVARLHRCCATAGRDPATIQVSVRGIAAGDVDHDLLHAYARAGVSHVGVTLPVRDRQLALATLERLAQRVPDHLAHP